jgi:hypothetical protein
MRFASLIVVVAAAGLVTAGVGHAAEPACGAPSPKVGAVVRGPVLLISDGRTMCLAGGDTPETWTRVQLPYADVTRGVLMAAAFGKNAECRIGPGGEAACTVEGRSLAEELHRPEILKAALRWR